MITDISSQRSRFEYIKLRFKIVRPRAKLFYFKLQRAILGLKIRALSFKCFIFGLDENKALAEDRRRAVLVDKFFEKAKHYF